MKPSELVYALMASRGMGATDLAKAIGLPKQQPNIHKFIHGGVKHPNIALAKAVADHFGFRVEAMYLDKEADTAAKELGVAAIPVPTPEPRRRRLGADWLLEQVAGLPLAEQEKFIKRWEKKRAAAPEMPDLPSMGGLHTNYGDILQDKPGGKGKK